MNISKWTQVVLLLCGSMQAENNPIFPQLYIGIMSAIDFYCDVGTTTGQHGEKRVVITFNGKFLPHIEQKMDDNTAKSPRD